MKKIIGLLIVLLFISVVILSGCNEQTTEQTTEEKLVTVSLDSIGFKSYELPDTLPVINEVFNDTEMSSILLSGQSVIILERYNVFYGLNETNPSLGILITKYDSKDSAIKVFSEYNETLFDKNLSGLIYERIPGEEIGDESAIGNTTSGFYQIIFRKLNVVTRLYSNLSQKNSIDYAKILINHIELNFNGEEKSSSFNKGNNAYIKIINDCSGVVEGKLIFEMYDFDIVSTNFSTVYKTYKNISIQPGEIWNYTFLAPKLIYSEYFSVNLVYFRCGENSTNFSHSSKWLGRRADYYRVYETENGIDIDFL